LATKGQKFDLQKCPKEGIKWAKHYESTENGWIDTKSAYNKRKSMGLEDSTTYFSVLCICVASRWEGGVENKTTPPTSIFERGIKNVNVCMQ
jgi:hypothetical protein